MEKANKAKKDYYVVDMLHIVKTLWSRIFVIAFCTILCAVIGFVLARFVVTPKYTSEIMLYVNNSSVSTGNDSISSSQITAAQNLVKTYRIILKGRTTLEEVIAQTGVEYSYEELYEMVDAEAVDESEILRVTVTANDPTEAARIVNGIADVLPARISQIIKGSSMELVDKGIVNNEKVSPSLAKYTIIGGVIGFILCAFVIALMAIMDGTIHDEEYIQKSYNYPILAKIPNLLIDSSSGYKNYKKYYSSYEKDSVEVKGDN